MKIKWLGHASFLITANNGTRIVTDPFENVFGLQYAAIDETAEAVTVSHDHGDHNNVGAVKGNPKVITSSAPVEIGGIAIRGIDTYHDGSEGSERGTSIIFCFDVDGIRICHLGDLGHLLSGEQVAAIGKVDVLMTPVGGNFTIDATAADTVVGMLKPSVVIPMHFMNDKCPQFPVAGVSEFATGKMNVTVMDSSEVEYRSGSLPSEMQVVILQSAC